MEMFKTVKVFNEELQGKAVELSGSAINGTYVITRVQPYQLSVVGSEGSHTILLSAVEDRKVTIDFLEKRKPTVRELNEQYIQEQAEEIKTGIKRTIKNKRTYLQKQTDNAMVEEILKANGEPLQLSSILSKMQEAGRYHWTHNNASGMMSTAMNAGCKIKKVKMGVYAYDKGAKA